MWKKLDKWALLAGLLWSSATFGAQAPTVHVTGQVVMARDGYPGAYSTDRPKPPVPNYTQLFIDQGNNDPIAINCPERLNAWCWGLEPGVTIAADVVIRGTGGKHWLGDFRMLGTVTELDGVRMWKVRPAKREEP